ncbi:hypothetical protein AEQU3_01524 [Aequorivita antarctica]|nr:hypothetical protein AEQU3_01524 [Aequorivita antarctica]
MVLPTRFIIYSEKETGMLIFYILKNGIMAKGRNLRTSSKDAKALKQEKIMKKLEEKKMKKRKSRV